MLFLVVALLVLRPWEGELEEGPASAVAQVMRVIDGDTIEVRIGGHEEDVRLIGVDTPETVKPDTPVQCFGERASHFTKRRLSGQRVRLIFGVERRDIYGRLLAYVYLADLTLDVPSTYKVRARALLQPDPAPSRARPHADDPAQRPLRGAFPAPRAGRRAGRARPLGRLPIVIKLTA